MKLLVMMSPKKQHMCQSLAQNLSLRSFVFWILRQGLIVYPGWPQTHKFPSSASCFPGIACFCHIASLACYLFNFFNLIFIS